MKIPTIPSLFRERERAKRRRRHITIVVDGQGEEQLETCRQLGFQGRKIQSSYHVACNCHCQKRDSIADYSSAIFQRPIRISSIIRDNIVRVTSALRSSYRFWSRCRFVPKHFSLENNRSCCKNLILIDKKLQVSRFEIK